MKILVFDTEATGLPTEKNASITEVEKWPYIVQLSYILFDTDKNQIIQTKDSIVKLPDLVYPSERSVELHGITKEISNKEGGDIKSILNNFNKCLSNSDYIIGHNLSFDKRLIMVECKRNKIKQNFTINGVKKLEFCTMKNSVNLCKIESISKINGEKYLKYPSQSELHNYLFNNIPSGLHNSMADVIVCLRCYYKLMYDRDVLQICEPLRILYNNYCRGNQGEAGLPL
jgi:DNA polymerase III epsilon subunit-like protein